MPRKRTVDDGHETNRNARVDPIAVDGSPISLSSVFGLPPSDDRAAAAATAFYHLLGREDGWVRIGGSDLEKVNYWKYKFAHGPYRGKYVMYVVQVGDWVAGVCGLAQKVQDVDEGRLKPSYDTFYDPR